MLDYRYLSRKGDDRYTCGLARQGIIEFLRIYAEESVFLGPEWYLALSSFKNNSPVIGFTVEQMIISRLASSGLRWGDTDLVILPAPLMPFSGSVTALSIDKPSTYYVPLQFNFKAIDALYVEVNEHKRTAKIVAIQITVAKRHTDSASNFFADWEAWTCSLRGFTITPIFLWIVENKRGKDEVEAKLIELRQRPITGRSNRQNPCQNAGNNAFGKLCRGYESRQFQHSLTIYIQPPQATVLGARKGRRSQLLLDRPVLLSCPDTNGPTLHQCL
jgi:hypothetical protein